MGSCRCKMCGGHIHFDNDASVATCEYCGTEQTIVQTNDLKKLGLFNRANALRMQNEFDKAQLTYDNILIDDPNNAEAHWGICLCRYGIEYIEEGNTKKRIPTCHRTIIKSIFEDLDYKESIDNADVVAKRVYEAEAKAIDKLQKDIIKVSQKEALYDIFISYKEHDKDNNRTPDSIYAEKFYYNLKEKGYRVFFSKVTLKGKDTQEYEPIIFSALISSKVMISIGSKKEYFDSIWEKNEWARFLSFMQENHNKYLIPCYFDMESFDMPDEFLAFESVNLKVDSDDVLFNRIDKLFGDKNKTVATNKTFVEPLTSSLNNRLERIKVCLSEGDFQKADSLIEDLLNIDYKCAKAYFYKIFVNLKMKDEADFIRYNIHLDSDKNYYKALEYADDVYKVELKNLNKYIKERIEDRKKQEAYDDLKKSLATFQYDRAMEIAKSIKGYRDVDNIVNNIKEECYQNGLDAKKKGQYEAATKFFHVFLDYKDSQNLYIECGKERVKQANNNRLMALFFRMDDIIQKMDNKVLTNNDKEDYSRCMTEASNLGIESSGTKTLSYYQEKRHEVMSSKVILSDFEKEQKKRDRQERRYKIFKLLKVLGLCLLVIGYLAFLIVPIIVFASKGNSKGAGIWCGIDTLVIIVTIIVGVKIADHL